MYPYARSHQLLWSIPGIDVIAAAMILIEVGDEIGPEYRLSLARRSIDREQTTRMFQATFEELG